MPWIKKIMNEAKTLIKNFKLKIKNSHQSTDTFYGRQLHLTATKVYYT